MESAATITGLISRGLAKMASFSVLPFAVLNMVPWEERWLNVGCVVSGLGRRPTQALR